MLKEQEQTAAKYTPSGKRKFKAKVISAGQQALSIFGHSSTSQEALPTTSKTLEKFKYKMTQKDFRTKEAEEPIKFEESKEAPKEREHRVPRPGEGFKPTSEDFRKK